MTGLALQDLTVAEMLWREAEAAGLGQIVPWTW
jgi:ornithine cyclodeaminase